jgi:rubrerythrin
MTHMEPCLCCGAEYEVEDSIPRTPEEAAQDAIDYAEFNAKIEAQRNVEHLRRLTQPLYCSFCGDSGVPLAAGPGVYICRGCVNLAEEAHVGGETVMLQGDVT